MTSRKRSGSGFVQPQGRRSTRRRANAAPAESGANGDETPATAAKSGGATAASTAVGGGEAISATQASSAPTPAQPAGPPHTGLSTSGPFVQYVPGSNRTRSGPPHVCTVCNKPFMRPSTLATHMNIHSGATPYLCGFQGCSARFNARSNATRHRYLHGAIFAQQQADIETGSAFRGQTVFVEPIVASSSGMPMDADSMPTNASGVPESTSASTSAYEVAGEGGAWSVENGGGSNEAGPSTQQKADHEVRWMPVNQVARGRVSYSPISTTTGSRGSKRQRKAGPQSGSAEG
ncbi:hypothetical protein GGG16DRAFT_44986 [Schizophyllum commune]